MTFLPNTLGQSSDWPLTPVLQPDVLSDMAQQAMSELLRDGTSQNTLVSYRSALRYWAAWYAARYGTAIALPLTVSVVLQFIVDHAERMTEAGLRHELPLAVDEALVAAGAKAHVGAMALNTLLHRISVVSKVHQQRGLSNPAQDSRVRELLSTTRRAYAKRGQLPTKKDALTKDPLTQVLNTCDTSLRGLRDRALLLFAWSSGGRRRSEVTSADMRFLNKMAPGQYTYLLSHSKTNQTGMLRPESFKPIVGPAAAALEAWLNAANITEGRIFRRIRKGDQVAEPLAAAAVRNIVMERCALAGVSGDFSAHSLRSGFVTEASRQGVPLGETMGMTDHRSVSVVMGYFRSEDRMGRKVANLLNDPEGPVAASDN